MSEAMKLGHTANLTFTLRDDEGEPLDLAATGVTRAVLVLAGKSVDSDVYPAAFDWATGGAEGVMSIDLTGLSFPVGVYAARLVIYHPGHADGQVVVESRPVNIGEALPGVEPQSHLSLLADPSTGNGSDRVAHTGTTRSVTQTLDDHEGRVTQNEADIAANTTAAAAAQADADANADAIGRGNLLIGGDFSRNAWQEGTNFPAIASGTYVADMWRVWHAGSVDVTREDLPVGTKAFGHEVQHALKWAYGATRSGTDTLRQKIEGVRTMAGRTVRVALTARASVALNLPMRVRQNFGGGGSTAVETTFPDVFPLTTEWQDFTTAVAVPEITGKTISPADNSFDFIFRMQNLPVGEWVEIAFVTLYDDSEERTPVRRSAGEELRLAKRYFERLDSTNSYTNFGTGFASSSSRAWIVLPYAEKRGIPSISGPQPGKFNISAASNFANVVTTLAAQASTISTRTMRLNIDTTTALTPGEACNLRTGGVAGAAFLDIDARL